MYWCFRVVYVISEFLFRQKQIVESGVIKALEDKWWPENNKCQNNKLKAKAITLVDMQGVFYFAGGMFFLCGVVLFIECLVHRYRRKEM